MRELEHSRPADIEAESFRIIGAELAERGIVLPADQAPLVKRAIHTTADLTTPVIWCSPPGRWRPGSGPSGPAPPS